MRSLLSAVFAVVFFTQAHAAQEVQVYWPFSISSQQAAMVRGLIDNANTQQSKYKFVFAHRPGAGGSVAATSVAASTDLAILATSSSFYIRPMLYKDSHNITDFSLTNTICSNQPLGIFSSTRKELSKDNFKIGIIPGSITSLVARTVAKNNSGLIFTEIPYKGTPEATTDMLGGHIDGSVDFVGPAAISRLGEKATVLGITGTTSYEGLKTFGSQGITGLDEVVNSYFLFVKNTASDTEKKEISDIFYKASTSTVEETCTTDKGQIVKVPYNDLEKLNSKNVKLWKEITAGIPVK